jgi:hypothetical protein
MPLVEATVVPKQPWGQDGEADVWIRGDENVLMVLRVEHRPTSTDQNIIQKSVYAPGLIRINTDTLPTKPTLEIEVEVTTENEIRHQDWPQGGVYFK